jgi:hypothetical protein
MPLNSSRWIPAIIAQGLCIAAILPGTASGASLINPFHDPFERVTTGIPGCVDPRPPTYTPAQMRDEEHWRVEQGNSCYLAGKCRYSNSYFYDKGIARRLSGVLSSTSRLRDSSIWILVQGRIVELSGCVERKSQIAVARKAAEQVPDVQGVLVHLMVGTQGARPYK